MTDTAGLIQPFHLGATTMALLLTLISPACDRQPAKSTAAPNPPTQSQTTADPPPPIKSTEPETPYPESENPKTENHDPVNRNSAHLENIDPRDLSPIETIQLLRHRRQSGLFSRVKPHLQPGDARHVLALLRAVDRLELSTRLFESKVREKLGRAAAQKFDFSNVANLVGVFSRDATLLTEKINPDGDHATVSFQIANRVPLQSAELHRATASEAQHWILTTDAIPGVPEQIEKLADVVDKITRSLDHRSYTANQLQRELALLQSPILRKLEQLTTKN